MKSFCLILSSLRVCQAEGHWKPGRVSPEYIWYLRAESQQQSLNGQKGHSERVMKTEGRHPALTHAELIWAWKTLLSMVVSHIALACQLIHRAGGNVAEMGFMSVRPWGKNFTRSNATHVASWICKSLITWHSDTISLHNMTYYILLAFHRLHSNPFWKLLSSDFNMSPWTTTLYFLYLIWSREYLIC